MKLTLHVWRQTGKDKPGMLVKYDVPNASPNMSFLEMLDVLNESLIARGQEPVAFDHDCREGICGTCGVVINGEAPVPDSGSSVVQLHMPSLKAGYGLPI